MKPVMWSRATTEKKKSKLFDSRFLNANIFWYLYSFMTVNSISLALGNSEAFYLHFLTPERPNNQSIDQKILVRLLVAAILEICKK